MSSRRTSSRPNRRQIDKTTHYIAPLAISWLNPTINGPNTVFEGGVNQTLARISTEAGTPEVQRIILAGIVEGTWIELPALEIANEGESASGTTLQITFEGILDLTQPWELRIPADTQLIQSRHGGRLTGSFTDGQPITEAEGGFVRQSNIVENAGTLPALFWPASATVTGPNEITVQFTGAPGSPFTIDSIPPFTDSSGGIANGIVDAGGDVLELTFPSGCVAGSTLSFPDWNPQIRGVNGAWCAPFNMLTV